MTIDAQRHSDEMAAQRSQELAGDEAHYRLRKACAVRAVEMYELLQQFRLQVSAVDKLLEDIEYDAQ